MFQRLDPARIVATLGALEQRISERFPNSGLLRIGGELSALARETSETVAKIARPNFLMRVITSLFLVAMGICFLWLLTIALNLEASTELTSIVQGIDATTSLIIVFGGVAFYAWTLEGRWRREQALKKLHELRSIVHVIDMHQLKKDPSTFGAPRTTSSPMRDMTPFEIQRYLGYCSELLSLASKVAALYTDRLRDPAIVDAVGDIERLSTSLSQKIWQKIELAQRHIPSRPANDAYAPKAIS